MRKWNLLLLLLFAGIAAVCQNYPVAVDDFYNCIAGETITLKPLDNDVDPEGMDLVILSVDGLHTYNDTIIYFSSNRADVGTTTYTYYACQKGNEFNYSNPATITITVEGETYEPPVAVNDYYEIPVNSTMSFNVSENDIDPEGDIADAYLSQWRLRKFELGYSDEQGDIITYSSYSTIGIDSAFYTIRSSTSNLEDTGWVFINVTDGTPEVIAMDDYYTANAGYEITVNPLENDTPAECEIEELVDDHQSRFKIKYNELIFSPECTFEGIDSIDYIIKYEDNGLEKYDRATAYVEVAPFEDFPIANEDHLIVPAYETVSLAVLENDVYDGEVTFDVSCYGNEDVDCYASGNELFFIAREITNTPLKIRYRIVRAGNDLIYSPWTNIIIEVTENNILPVAVADSVEIYDMETGILTGFLDNDIDPEGYELQLFLVHGSAGNMNLEIVGKDSIRYSPEMTDGEYSGGTYSCQYINQRVEQTSIKSNIGQIYVKVIPQEEAPVAHPDTLYISEIHNYTVNVLDNDDFKDLTPTNIELVFMVGQKHMVVNVKDLSLEVSPSLGYTGWESINYIVTLDDGSKVYGTLAVFLDTEKTQKAFLDANQITAIFNSNGINFQDHNTTFYNDPYSFYEYEGFSFLCSEVTMVNAFTNSTFWITGTSESGYNHFSGDTYLMGTGGGAHDFQPGPISDHYDNDFKKRYVRVWKLDRGMIANHVNNYQNSGYEMPDEIRTWPGNGDVGNNEAEQLAPYYDSNENGAYDPENGDYPLIRGDQSIFFILNDDTDHTASQGMRLKTEVHVMAYAFNTSEDETLNNTILVHYDVFNRSERDYDDTYFGILSNSYLQNIRQNLFGTDVALTSCFFYSPSEYGQAPAASTTILGGPLLESDGVDNPLGECDEGITGSGFGDGLLDNERLGLMTSVEPNYFYNSWWKNTEEKSKVLAEDRSLLMKAIGMDYDGRHHLSYGGNGFASGGAYGPDCRYMYPWESDPCNYGLEGEEPNGPKEWKDSFEGARSGLTSAGPFTFEAGSKEEFDIAYVYAFDPDDNSDTPSVNLLKQRIADLLQKRDNGEIYPYFITETGIQESPQEIKEALIYPSPAQNNITVRAELKNSASYNIFSSTGACVMSGTLSSGLNHPLSVNQFNTGIYIIKIENNNTQFTGKFIVR